MKSILASVLLLTSVTFSATYEQAPTQMPAPFGAFTYGNQLYVTIPGDCNKQSASLEISGLCNKNRFTRNFAVSCDVKLNVVSTLMYCTGIKYPPKAFVFDLANEQIAPEARELIIQYGQHSVRVDVNR